MIQHFKDKKITNLISEICYEHQSVVKEVSGNIAYLWYLYSKGVNAGNFKPFIFIAELNLLTYFKYLTEDEKSNMIGMLSSNDDDNAYIMAYSLLELRKRRIAEKGEWVNENFNYSDIIYEKDIINPELFIASIYVGKK